MILPDNETKVDLLNNEAIATTIVKLLRKRPDHPITVGVHGDWGAGKSSVLEMVEASLDEEERVLCLKFNGWRFQGFEDAKIALIEGIVTGLLEKRPALTKAGAAVKDIFRRIDWLKVAKKAGGLAVTAYTGIPVLSLEAVVEKLGGITEDPNTFTKENMEAALSEVQGLLKEGGESTNVPEEIAAFRKAFDELLKAAGVDQLIVLIDDLDRCLPDTAIETLEAVRLFVFTSRTAFVVAADEAMIEYAVRKHFPDLPDTTGPQTYARNYLEKLIQVPFRVPALGETETLIYVTLLLVGAELGESDPAFIKLISAAREKLKKPWDNEGLDPATVNTALGDKAPGVQNALALSAQIGPILASGTKGNPRQIKRFLNTLLLRHASAEARGFGSDVKLPILAKLMLAERFIPSLFDQIAMAAAAGEGVCADLEALEASAVQKSEAPVETKAMSRGKPAAKLLEVVKPADSPLLGEWLSSRAIQAWARVPPKIGKSDLRPYLFVAKERKDYFGSTTALGQLVSIVEKLLGPKMAVAGMEKELTRLAEPEAKQVFGALCSKVLSADDLGTEPAGAAGLAVLVKAHPPLQASLVDFLGSLPKNKLGPWVCNGWDNAIADPQMGAKFEELLGIWSKEGGQFLKLTAASALRMRKQSDGR